MKNLGSAVHAQIPFLPIQTSTTPCGMVIKMTVIRRLPDEPDIDICLSFLQIMRNNPIQRGACVLCACTAMFSKLIDFTYLASSQHFNYTGSASVLDIWHWHRRQRSNGEFVWSFLKDHEETAHAFPPQLDASYNQRQFPFEARIRRTGGNHAQSMVSKDAMPWGQKRREDRREHEHNQVIASSGDDAKFAKTSGGAPAYQGVLPPGFPNAF